MVSARKIIDILSMAGENDLVFAAITGGSSAMVNMPADGITINELKEANELLLKSGADIAKINTVRKHLCMIKGGRLVQFAASKCDNINIGYSAPRYAMARYVSTRPNNLLRCDKDTERLFFVDKIASSMRQRHSRNR